MPPPAKRKKYEMVDWSFSPNSDESCDDSDYDGFPYYSEDSDEENDFFYSFPNHPDLSSNESDCDDDEPMNSDFSDDELESFDDDVWGTNTSYFDELNTNLREIPSSNATGKEIDSFEKIFDEDIVTHIVHQTNLYAEQNQSNNWTVTTHREVKAFVGCLILMAIHRLPSIDHYWSSDPALRVDTIANVMTAKRFKKILENVHLNDNESQVPRSDPAHDKLFKLRPLIEMIQKNIANEEFYRPSSFLTVDESMVKFKGRSSLKQYQPLKPIKRGFKVWCLADSMTGYVTSFNVYTGKSNSDSPLGETVVLNLTKDVREESLVTFDNFFTSVDLLEKLLARKVFSCGTVKGTRKNLPDFMNKDPSTEKNMKRGEFQFATKGHVAATKWMDKKAVGMLSTLHSPRETSTVQRKQASGEKATVHCPHVVSDYNKLMGGVDRFDQMKQCYGIGRRSAKWWPRMMYFLIDLSIVNSFIAYKVSKGEQCQQDQFSFRLNLAKQLIQGFSSRKRLGKPINFHNKTKTVPDDVRFSNVGIHFPRESPTFRRCKLCSTKANEKRTRILCSHCDVPLCTVPCFEKFHNKN